MPILFLKVSYMPRKTKSYKRNTKKYNTKGGGRVKGSWFKSFRRNKPKPSTVSILPKPQGRIISNKKLNDLKMTQVSGTELSSAKNWFSNPTAHGKVNKIGKNMKPGQAIAVGTDGNVLKGIKPGSRPGRYIGADGKEYALRERFAPTPELKGKSRITVLEPVGPRSITKVKGQAKPGTIGSLTNSRSKGNISKAVTPNAPRKRKLVSSPEREARKAREKAEREAKSSVTGPNKPAVQPEPVIKPASVPDKPTVQPEPVIKPTPVPKQGTSTMGKHNPAIPAPPGPAPKLPSSDANRFGKSGINSNSMGLGGKKLKPTSEYKRLGNKGFSDRLAKFESTGGSRKTTFKKSSGKKQLLNKVVTKTLKSNRKTNMKGGGKKTGKIPHFVVTGESWNNRDLSNMKLNSKNNKSKKNNKPEPNNVGYGYAHIGPDYEGCIYGNKDPSYTDNNGKHRKYVENVECGNIADKDPNESFSKDKGDICWCPIDENDDMTDLMFN